MGITFKCRKPAVFAAGPESVLLDPTTVMDRDFSKSGALVIGSFTRRFMLYSWGYHAKRRFVVSIFSPHFLCMLDHWNLFALVAAIHSPQT